MSRAPSTLMTNFSDGNIIDFFDSRNVEIRNDINHRLQMHSSLVQRLSFERELEGHQGCVNSVAWNSSGSLLVSGSDDALINIWSYSSRKLLHSIESGHSANIFCTKFVPETCDELVVSCAGDAEVRQFNLSLLTTGKPRENAMEPSALFQCHSRRVKKLAVEAGNPNVVWSASEDGTLRQHDFREGTSCPPNGSSHQECRSVLLDLRWGAKKSLAEPPKQCLSLKSCDISTTRPHLLLVGGSDAFARLYDRRMLPPLSSCQTMTKPPPCVGYYCPMHLSDHRTPSLHLTHVTFSPTGEEVLLSYSGEHVYLMDVYSGGENVAKYSVDDVSEQYKLVPTTSKTTTEMPARQVFGNDIQRRRRNSSDMLGKCKELAEIAEAFLRESKNYYGIEACSEVLDGNASIIGPHLRHECLCTRAALLLKRKWKNDIHMAIRDCKKARSIEPLSFKAHFYMSEALLQLGKQKEALEYAIAAQLLAPSNSEVAERVISIKEHLAAAEAEKSNANDGQSQSEAPPRRMRTAIDVLNSDAPVDDVRSREDSDYEAEVELDFETSMSGDEANAAHSGPHINFRFRRRSDSARESSCTNGSCGSTSSSSSQNDNSSYQPETVVDMKQRYVGHCNVGTDIKQASFLGQRGEYVASGSDDGRWFIWEKRTGRLVKMLSGDEAVVNCVQCHPFDCTIATSGIDNTIKIWTPEAPAPSIVAGVSVGPEMADVLSAMETNQNKLSRNRNVLPFELLERFRMHEFAEGTLHPFECAQT